MWKEALKKTHQNNKNPNYKQTEHQKKPQPNQKPDAGKSEKESFPIVNSQIKPKYQTYSCLEFTHFFLFIAENWLPFPSNDIQVITATELDFDINNWVQIPSLWREQVRITQVLFPFYFLCTN